MPGVELLVVLDVLEDVLEVELAPELLELDGDGLLVVLVVVVAYSNTHLSEDGS